MHKIFAAGRYAIINQYNALYVKYVSHEQVRNANKPFCKLLDILIKYQFKQMYQENSANQANASQLTYANILTVDICYLKINKTEMLAKR